MPSCRCSTDGYRVCVKTFVEAEEGSSVVLPCSFSYPAHSPPSRVTVSWKSDMFRDRIVFQSADGFVRESLKGRLSLVGDLNKNDASISIRDVNINDFKSYTCQPVLYYENRDRVTIIPVIATVLGSFLFLLVLVVSVWARRAKKRRAGDKFSARQAPSTELQQLSLRNVDSAARKELVREMGWARPPWEGQGEQEIDPMKPAPHSEQ
ncbi:unnamed protein product [Lampetra planeri]